MKKLVHALIASAVLAGLLAVPAVAADKQRIGISKIVSHPALDAVVKGIRDELAAQKINVEFDEQNANGDANTAASIAAKFKSDKVALAIGVATPTSQALVKNLKDTPVIFSAVTDPVKAGLVKSLKVGDKNVTGVSDMTPVRQQIELLLKMKKIKRLGHVYTSSEENAVVLAGMVKQACKELNIEFVETTVSKSAEVKQAVQAIVRRVDAIYISTDNTVVSAIGAITDVAMKSKIPVMSADPSSAAGHPVLAAWGFDYYKMGRVTGKLAIEVLKGRKPETLPTRFMTKASDMDLLINLDVAKKLGISVPKELLASAKTIIQDGKPVKK